MAHKKQAINSSEESPNVYRTNSNTESVEMYPARSMPADAPEFLFSTRNDINLYPFDDHHDGLGVVKLNLQSKSLRHSGRNNMYWFFRNIVALAVWLFFMQFFWLWQLIGTLIILTVVDGSEVIAFPLE